MSLVKHLELIYQAAIGAVSPYKLVYDALKFTSSEIPFTSHGRVKSISGLLTCGERSFEVDANVKSETITQYCIIDTREHSLVS